MKKLRGLSPSISIKLGIKKPKIGLPAGKKVKFKSKSMK